LHGEEVLSGVTGNNEMKNKEKIVKEKVETKRADNTLRLKSRGQVLFQSDLNNVMVLNKLSVSVEYKTLKSFNELENGSYLGVWEGDDTPIPKDRKDFLGITELTVEKSKGKYTEAEIKVDKTGVDLQTGVYTIGLLIIGDVARLSMLHPLSYLTPSIHNKINGVRVH